MPAQNARDMTLLSREFRPALMAYFLRRVNSRAEAEDLTQEVFVRLAARGEEAIENRQAYVFQVAANLLRDRARRSKTQLDYRSSIGEIEALNVELIDPYRVTAGRSLLSAMCKALEELSKTTRDVFVLYRLEGMSKATIADGFGISISSVEKHITKSTVFLAERFGDDL